MIRKVADYIISPLGIGTADNYQAIREGRSLLLPYDGRWGLPETFCASLIPDGVFTQLRHDDSLPADLTRFETLLVSAAKRALATCDIDASAPGTLFIISSTKGNVEYLDDCYAGTPQQERILLGAAAKKVTEYFGNPNAPLVVSNACISGVSAQVEAMRCLQARQYSAVVVLGADVQSPFIVSGFQSLHALSPETCRPFDIDRIGLNLGEAVGCIILVQDFEETAADAIAYQSAAHPWTLLAGAVRNDAYHVSAPSKTGEGSYQTLMSVLNGYDKERLAFINVHGTATPFNDDMESKAIYRAGLQDVPVNGLKGYYGHTMGAAGVIETIISMAAIDDGCIPATKGFEEQGVRYDVNISNEHRATSRQAFVKMISGFGGCNGAVLWEKQPSEKSHTELPHNSEHAAPSLQGGRGESLPHNSEHAAPSLQGGRGESLPDASRVRNNNIKVCARVELSSERDNLTEIYRRECNDYPKFFKMDHLCKLGFIATELLLKECPLDDATPDRHDVAVILFNRSASINADRQYQHTIQDRQEFFPSPSVFVYTLPNIVTGEIAMRHGIHGETSFYVLDHRDDAVMRQHAQNAFLDHDTRYVITGWIDCTDKEHFEADMQLLCLDKNINN